MTDSLSPNVVGAVADFLHGLSCARDLNAFFDTLFSEIGKLIPFDHSVQWCRAVNDAGAGLFQAFTSGNKSIDMLLDSNGDIQGVESFNSYYRFVQPLPDHFEKYSYAIDYRVWANTEYYVDFIKPHGIRHSLVPVTRGLKYNCTLQRTGNPGFSAGEALLAGYLAPHIDCIYTCLSRREELESGLFSVVDLDRIPCRLTPRQAEVIRLTLLRCSADEVAACLCISRRTVEKHLADVYEKLNIRSRYELVLLYAPEE